MLLVQLSQLHHGSVAGAADDEPGPVHENGFLLCGDVGVNCGPGIQLFMPLSLGAAQDYDFFSGKLLHLA